MDHAALLAPAAAGDEAARAALYDAYAVEVHDLCFAILRDPVASAGAALETWRLAFPRFGDLDDPSLARALLLAIARHQAVARATIAQPVVPVVQTPADVAWRALAEVDPAAQVLAYLQARHGMTTDDPGGLPAAIGHSRARAEDITARANADIDRHLDAALLIAVGQERCPRLRSLATRRRLAPRGQGDRIARHAESCGACDATLAALPQNLALIGSRPLAPPPPSLRAQALGSDRPNLAFSGVYGPAAEQLWPPPLRRRSSRQVPLDAVAGVITAAAIIAVMIGVWILLRDDDEGQAVAAGDAAESVDGAADLDGAAPESTTVQPAEPQPLGTTVPSTEPPVPPVDPGPTTSTDAPTSTTEAPNSSTTVPGSTTTTVGSSTTSTTPGSGEGDLTLDVVNVILRDSGPPGVITVANQGAAALAWTAESGSFSVAPSSGTLQPGESTIVEVSGSASVSEGTYGNGVLFLSGATAKGVTVRVERDPAVSQVVSDPAQFCDKGNNKVTLKATVTDESGLTVSVRWRVDGASTQSAPMGASGDVYSYDINPVTGASSFEWWVVATDSRGNVTQTSPKSIPFVAC